MQQYATAEWHLAHGAVSTLPRGADGRRDLSKAHARRDDSKHPDGREPVKKLNETKKTKLKIERNTLRMLQGNELRRVEGGTDNNNGITAASGGPVCCA
jgi:hypothetical protein